MMMNPDVDGSVLAFRHPFTSIVAGPTKVGKTEWVIRLVKHANKVILPPPEQVIWCYNEWQDRYNALLEYRIVKLVQGVPEKAQLKQDSKPKLLILDDMMDTMKDNKQLTELFIKGCHHWNISCIHICQSLFFGGLRTLRINAHYIILMKSPADKLQISMLARQMFPGKTSQFMEVYSEATSVQYGYLVVDCSPETPETYRLRSQIFPDDSHAILWVIN
jgi:Poxvirus A32 protein